MSWVEGVGDEVIFFLVAACVVLLLVILAWKSTEVPEPRPLTIRILRRQEEIPVPSPVSTTNRPIDTDFASTNQDSPSRTASQNFPDLISVPRDTSLNSHDEDHDDPQNDNIQSTNLCNEEREQVTSTNTLPENGNCDEVLPGTSNPEEGEESTTLRQRLKNKPTDTIIKIRLKYIDDTQKIVEENNQTSLGEFKRQHFQSEIAANKTVKLIFNAKVLESETLSLSQLGLDDNCVVHCLVINRPPASVTASSQNDSSASRQQNPTSMPSIPPLSDDTDSSRNPPASSIPQIDAGIDVGGLLVPLFGVVMALIWYCRIAYAVHFTTATTVALVGLSVLFLFSFFICFPVFPIN